MTRRKRIVLQPEYIKDFSCVGSKCEDSCCIGWKVSLDKKTYLTYKNMKKPELKPIIQKMVNRDRSQNSDCAYGKINMESDGRCPFLNEENLCKIYIHAGEEYLSDTCTFYPRNTNRIDGKLERSSSVSCPEVSRLALLNPNGIAFEHIEEEDDDIRVNINFDTEGHLFMNRPQRYFWDIRIFSLSLLQNRNYKLGDRLIILGIVYKKIEKLYDEKNMKSLPNMLENMSNLIEDGDLKEELEKVPVNYRIQMSLAKEMTFPWGTRYLRRLKHRLN